MDTYRPIASRSGYAPVLWGLAVAALEAGLQLLALWTPPPWAAPFIPMVAAGLRFLVLHLRTRTETSVVLAQRPQLPPTP